MHLAKVVGKVISTQKTDKLVGSKLLIIRSIDEHKNMVEEENVLVAIDLVGAGMGDLVLVDWGSSMYEDKLMSADMAIVGIVDDIQTEEE